MEPRHHKAAIGGLPEGRREIYRRLRRQAATPEPEDLELPLAYEEPGGDDSFERHLYANAAGEFSCKLNEWERATVEAELADEKVLGWLRNVPRKSWAMTIPYKYDGEDAPMYPDFLFFRGQGDGVVVDILEPHHLGQDDSWAKAVGLADFAVRHGDRFGRIEMVIKEKDKLIRLDVNREGIRDKVGKSATIRASGAIFKRWGRLLKRSSIPQSHRSYPSRPMARRTSTQLTARPGSLARVRQPPTRDKPVGQPCRQYPSDSRPRLAVSLAGKTEAKWSFGVVCNTKPT